MAFDNTNYVLLTRQNGLFRKVEVLSNNVANANTPGFKSEKVVFDKYLHNATHNNIISFSQDVASVVKLHRAGQYTKTENTLDVAVKGRGFYFRVNTPMGERFTRAGNFTLNATGQIVTSQGYPVLNNGGEAITLNLEEMKLEDIVIREDGSVTFREEQLGQLGIAYFENEHLLEKVGNNLYEALVPPTPNETYAVYQGMLELSNVDSITEMTSLVDAQNDVRTLANLVNSLDDMEKNAIKVFGKQQ
ncbi:MAG: flagellar hook-basal body complex protein [Sphingobacteriia bacterium]|nr:flagellar hook-basal body complex protein [Sphingobacteriia bacterium]